MLKQENNGLLQNFQVLQQPHCFAPFSSALFRRVAPLSARSGRAPVTSLLDSSAVLLRYQLKDFDGQSLNWDESEAEAEDVDPEAGPPVIPGS